LIAPAGVPPFEEFGNGLRTRRGPARGRRPRRYAPGARCVAVIEYPVNAVISVALPIVEKIVL
jgi:hypothetical protein